MNGEVACAGCILKEDLSKANGGGCNGMESLGAELAE